MSKKSIIETGLASLVIAGATFGLFCLSKNQENPKLVQESRLEERVKGTYVISHDEGQILIEGYATDTEIKRVSEAIERFSPTLRKSIKKIYVPSPHGALTAAAQGQGKIILSPQNLEYHLIAHEAGHILTFQVDETIPENSERWQQEYSKVCKELVEFGHNKGTADQLAKEILKYKKINPFVERWISLAGEVYRKDGFHPNKWEDNKDGPREGLVCPYGSSNYDEDIATFVEKAYETPEFFHSLTNQNNYLYDCRYVEKLALLKEFGFITPTLYEKCIRQNKN